jgi:hypothetical protein
MLKIWTRSLTYFPQICSKDPYSILMDLGIVFSYLCCFSISSPTVECQLTPHSHAYINTTAAIARGYREVRDVAGGPAEEEVREVAGDLRRTI